MSKKQGTGGDPSSTALLKTQSDSPVVDNLNRCQIIPAQPNTAPTLARTVTTTTKHASMHASMYSNAHETNVHTTTTTMILTARLRKRSYSVQLSRARSYEWHGQHR